PTRSSAIIRSVYSGAFGGRNVRMIGFDLTQEQTDLRDLVHEFARDVIRPAAPEWDEKEETPWPIMKQAHELGLDTYSYPEEYGGGGGSAMGRQTIVPEQLTGGGGGRASDSRRAGRSAPG